MVSARQPSILRAITATQSQGKGCRRTDPYRAEMSFLLASICPNGKVDKVIGRQTVQAIMRLASRAPPRVPAEYVDGRHKNWRSRY
jgi:hypothetical protein